MARCAIVVVVALLQITVGKDLTWIPNSNWDNPANWNLGRLTYANEAADFSQAPDSSIIYLNSDVTVQSIVLPINGKIVLGANASIRFSNPIATTGDAGKSQVNYFIGARQNWWECGENWRTPEGLPADTAPCGNDKAIFPAGASFSFVKSNTTVSVQELILRGTPMKSITGDEFSLDLAVNPNCSSQPALCACYTVKCFGWNKPLAEQGGPNVASAAAGPVIGILLLLFLVIPLTIVAVGFCWRARRTGSYKRERLDEEMAERAENNIAEDGFCNPTYDEMAGVKEDKLAKIVSGTDATLSTSSAARNA